MSILLLVRHAHAGDPYAWTAPDDLRPLSAKGVRQAEKLVFELVDRPVDRVLSSPYLRCIQTVEPLTLERGIVVESCDALAEGSGTAVLELLDGSAAETVVLCSHGDVIGELLEALSVPEPRRAQKASVWVIDTDDGHCVTARYLPPPT